MTKIIFFEITEPVDQIFIEPEFNKLFIVVFRKNKPLGILRLTVPIERVIHSRDIFKVAAAQLNHMLLSEIIKEQMDSNEKASLPVSVIVCTRDRADYLDRCLASLEKLDYPDYEVVVVDNCTKDSSVLDVAVKYRVKYVREDIPGLNNARNRGVRESSNEIIAFIDDDACAFPGWLHGVSEAFSEDSVSAVTGLVLPAEFSTYAQSDFEKFGGMGKGFKPFIVKKEYLEKKKLFRSSAWGVGANMAFRKDIFRKIGYFNPILDVGTPTAGGGDLEFFFRVIYRGFVLRYEPSAVIKHFHRREYPLLKKQIFNNGRSFPAYMMVISKYTDEKYDLLRFAVINWLTKWIIFSMIKSALTFNAREFKFAAWTFSGFLTSIPAYIKSKREYEKLITGKGVYAE